MSHHIVKEVWVIRHKASGDIVRFNGHVSWSGKGFAKLSYAAEACDYGGSQRGQPTKGAWDRQDEYELVELLEIFKKYELFSGIVN